MFSWFTKRVRKQSRISAVTTAERIREKYLSFRDLLAINSECLEVIVALQEDLQYIPPRRDIVQSRVTTIFQKAAEMVALLERLVGVHYEKLHEKLQEQQHEVERYIAELQELATPRLAAWLHEIGMDDVAEAGGKAAVLGEVKRKLDLPVPNGYVVTTEAYRQFCAVPHWHKIRDAIHDVEPNDMEAVRDAARMLQELVMDTPLPRAVEVAVADRARALVAGGQGLAVRSSVVGEGPEGGARTCAGQFLSLINVPPSQVLDAYKQVVASRFSERALAYRMATGLLEVDTPIAVLVLPVIQAKASGIMYTRDPSNPRSRELWITGALGLGLDIASGGTAADLFMVSRDRRHHVTESHIANKPYRLAPNPEGGLTRVALDPSQAGTPSLTEEELKTLAAYGTKLEDHFRAPQDVEWAIDQEGRVWILQTRPLALVTAGRARAKVRANVAPVLRGGRTVYPGQVSGRAWLVDDHHELDKPPERSILFIRRASPEIVRVFPHITGLVAEWGNVAGHAAALLREFKVPSVFLMEGAFERIKSGDAVSLDSVQCTVYPGRLWDGGQSERIESVAMQTAASDPISKNILTLHLLDPSASEFRPAGCRSTHDVLRYCHEKSVEAMFTVNDIELDHGQHTAKDLKTPLPLNLSVLDLGGGLRPADEQSEQVAPEEIISLPFRALWRGISHPDVSWKRDMPAGLGDLASVMANSFRPQDYSSRPLGRKSYLLVAEEYMNLNARVAYHFTLVDASLTEIASKNYIAFRFAGGGATAFRRHLRARFVERVLLHYGFLVDRRGDLVNAWLKKAPATETFDSLDVLGRLLATTSQLDMYMTSHEVMGWYVQQFLEGNYRFQRQTGNGGVTETGSPR